VGQIAVGLDCKAEAIGRYFRPMPERLLVLQPIKGCVDLYAGKLLGT